MADDNSVKVFCRFRPFNRREIQLGADQGVELIIKPGAISIGDASGEPREFPFDYAFDNTTTQTDVYEHCAQKSVQDIFQGYNGTIFAYGQTGAGKSWSMMGDKTDETNKGIIPRAAENIFASIADDSSGTKYGVTCSYLEVYREKIGDLLNTANKNLAVREHPSKGIYVDQLTAAAVTSWEEVRATCVCVGGWVGWVGG
jgi:kinesin family protein 5